jgi:hypothetical protein
MWSPQTGGTEQFEMDKKIEDGYFSLQVKVVTSEL